MASVPPIYPSAVGNIDVRNLPSVPNPEAGGTSTVWSMSIGTPEGEVLIPRVKNGSILSEDQAVNEYYKTGEHLGKFGSVPGAEQYAQQLHLQQQTAPLIGMLLNAFKF
jgi:hypothetical protein